MADFRLLDGMNYENAGANTGTSGAVALTGGGANVKGAWSQLIAATARDATGIFVSLGRTANFGDNALVDIGIGAAASEQVLVPNLFRYNAADSAEDAYTGVIPIAVPTGSRLSARCQSPTTASVTACAMLVEEGFASPAGQSRVTAYGALTATSLGTSVPCTTVNTKGAWTQLTASTGNQCSGLLLSVSTIWPGTNSFQAVLLDLGIGAGGSEQTILGNLPIGGGYFSSSGATVTRTRYYYFPLVIPAATRIAARAQNATGISTPSYVIVYGIE